jgi:dihydroorotate dehydrogenase
MIYRSIIRPILFRKDAERAHEFTLESLERLAIAAAPAAKRVFTREALKVRLAGVDFPNPVGLAAGCDKNARAAALWAGFGFGFVEVGTVTAQPQQGNPQPRVFRLAQDSAIINRLGFNSEGSEAVAQRLSKLWSRSQSMTVPLGVNIGKTKVVTGEDAIIEDYCTSFRRLAPYADYVAINVSSPNTPGLRLLQAREPLTALVQALKLQSEELFAAKASKNSTGQPVPLFIKISPDMSDEDMADVVEVALENGLSGVIATNTTLARQGVTSEQDGGLSGRPLRKRANEVMRFLYRVSEGKLPLIGVGGIESAEAAYERIRSGASLVQLYTGMVFEGPYLAKQINVGLMKLLAKDGCSSVAEVVGVDV